MTLTVHRLLEIGLFIGFVIGAVFLMRWQGRTNPRFTIRWAAWAAYIAVAFCLLLAAWGDFDPRHMAAGAVVALPIGVIFAARSRRATFVRRSS